MIFKALSLYRVYNFTFYNTHLEQGVDLFGQGMGRLAMSGLFCGTDNYFFEINLIL